MIRKPSHVNWFIHSSTLLLSSFRFVSCSSSPLPLSFLNVPVTSSKIALLELISPPHSSTIPLPPPSEPNSLRSVTYTDLQKRSHGLASHLLRRHTPSSSSLLSHPSNIGLLFRPSSLFVESLLSIWRSKNIAVPLSPSSSLDEMSHIITDSGLSVIMTSLFFQQQIFQLKQKFHSANASFPQVIYLDELMGLEIEKEEGTEGRSRLDFSSTAVEQQPFILEKSSDHPALILYTSGTTGKPKGVLHSHQSLFSQVSLLRSSWKFSSADVLLHTLPLHHTHGLVNSLLLSLFSSATLIFLPFFNEKYLWEFWLTYPGKASVFQQVPSAYHSLIKYFDHHHQPPGCPPKSVPISSGPSFIPSPLLASLSPQEIRSRLSQCRLMVSGSASLPATSLSRWEEISSHRLLERYGSTELGMVLSNPYDADFLTSSPSSSNNHPLSSSSVSSSLRLPSLVGLPFPGIDVKIDSSDPFVTPGELFVKSPSQFVRYWNNPSATASSLTADGYFRTGDFFQRDSPSGYFKCLGRISSDILKVSGFKVSAVEIEEKLLEIASPSISEVCVLGLPHSRLGEMVVALLVPSNLSLLLDGSSTNSKEFSLQAPQSAASSSTASFLSSLPLSRMSSSPALISLFTPLHSSASSAAPSSSPLPSSDHSTPSSALVDLDTFVRSSLSSLSSYKRPTVFLYLSSFPKNALGKKLKKEMIPQLLSALKNIDLPT